VQRLPGSADTGIEQLHAIPLDAQQDNRLFGIVTAHLKRLSIARTAAFPTRPRSPLLVLLIRAVVQRLPARTQLINNLPRYPVTFRLYATRPSDKIYSFSPKL
jgi:hypothetical protein